MAGEKLVDIGFTKEVIPPYYAIKESVFPFARFLGAPIVLTPEMRSTGEVMGIDEDLGIAFAKTQMAVQPPLPREGNVFISVKPEDKPRCLEIVREFIDLGFKIVATRGTANYLKEQGFEVKVVEKISDGGRPNVSDLIKNKEIQMIINTPIGMMPRKDEGVIRREAILHRICMMTTLSGAAAAVKGIRALSKKDVEVRSIQEFVELTRIDHAKKHQ
jgi:carbamoyl-phosphate synthase large subunit